MNPRMVKQLADIQSRIDFFNRLSEHVGSLIGEYEAGRAPQALMLSGSAGVGKRTLSRMLSMALLCESAKKPCGDCKACRRAENASHPNVILIQAGPNEKSVKVEQVRGLLDKLASYPLERGNRVVLLQLVDIFTPQAQNSLLKALEEPDTGTFFILTTSTEKAVLPTVRSRCRIVRVPLWPDNLLADLLILQGISYQKARDVCAAAGGSPGRAWQVFNEPAYKAVRELAEQTVLSIHESGDLPAASLRLKDARDDAGDLLDYLEDAAVLKIRLNGSDKADTKSAGALLEAVLKARKMRMQNVSWQAVLDDLLISILEDAQSCRM